MKNWTFCFASKGQAGRPTPLTPQLVDGVELERAGFGHVLETAAEGIVATGGGPVDAHGRVDSGLDIFGVHVALLRPAKVRDVRAGAVGLSDNRAAFDAAAG